MRLSDWFLMAVFMSVVLMIQAVVITDVNSTYNTTLNTTQLDSVMNTSLIENKSLEFQQDIDSATNSTAGFVTFFLTGGIASTVGLFMSAVGELFGLGGAILVNVLGVDASIAGLITGAMVVIVGLLLISIPFRWELTR